MGFSRVKTIPRLVYNSLTLAIIFCWTENEQFLKLSVKFYVIDSFRLGFWYRISIVVCNKIVIETKLINR